MRDAKKTLPVYLKTAWEALGRLGSIAWPQAHLSVSGKKENKAKVLKSHPEAGTQTREGNAQKCAEMPALERCDSQLEGFRQFG